MRLVTIEQARQHCRVDTADSEMLALYAEAAEQTVQDFLNRQVFSDVDELAAAVLDGKAGDDPIVANQAIIAAILLLTGHLYRNREAVTSENAVQLPLGAQSLLWPHRVGLGV